MSDRSPTFAVRMRGPWACFTRPELKVERVSYPVMTPSAARGALEAILWKPAIAWHIERIGLLKPIVFTAIRRNEVNNKAVAPAAVVIRDGGAPAVKYVEEDRAQRNAVLLKDVDYLVHAHFTMTERAGSADNLTKFVEMFQRRLARGQHFHQPYFGCREFVADVSPATPDLEPVGENRDLGIMLWDIAFAPGGNRPIFFRAKLDRGSLTVPLTPEAAIATIGGAA